MTVVGEAFIQIKPDTKGFATAAKDDVEKQSRSLGSTAAKAFGVAFGAAAVLSIGKQLFAEADEARKIGALTEAVIKSTGGAAKISVKDVGRLADQISRVTAIDDDDIQRAANLLLTFTNIRNEIGAGNNVFDQALGTLVDMGAAMGKDAASSAIQLGKALNDPITGITALTRVGVTFTQEQKDQIKALVSAGDTLSAQKIILAELSREFGGAAESQATAQGKLSVTLNNLKEQLGTALLPVLDTVSNALSVGLPRALELAGAAIAAVKQPFQPLIDAAQEAFDFMFDPSKGALGQSNFERGLAVVQKTIGDFLLGQSANESAIAQQVAKAFGVAPTPVGQPLPGESGLIGIRAADTARDAAVIAAADANASNFDKVIAKTGNTISRIFGLGIELHASQVGENIEAGLAEIGGRLQSGWGKVLDATNAREIFGAVQRFVGENPGDLFQNIRDGIGTGVLNAANAGVDLVQASVGDLVVAPLVNVFQGAIGAVGAGVDAVIAAPGALGNVAVNAVNGIVSAIGTGVIDAASDLADVGTDIVSGVVDGIVDSGKAITDAILGFLPSPTDVVKSFASGAVGIGKKIVGAVNPFGATGGTVTAGGLLLVGERGPELVRLPTGAQIMSAGFGNVRPGPVTMPTVNVTAPFGSQVDKSVSIGQLVVPAPPDASPLELAATVSEHFAWRFAAAVA